MNNRGFTVVELLASFALTMVIMVFLFEIVLQLKEVYITNALKTKIYDKNAIVAATLNNKISDIDCENNLCKINGKSDFIKLSADEKSVVIDDTTVVKYPDNIDKIVLDSPIGVYVDANRGLIKITYYVQSGYLDKMIVFNFVRSFNK